jgi:DNA polymerase IV (DinB-like DNA polymerase)
MISSKGSESRIRILSDLWNRRRIVIHVDLNSFYPSCEELRQTNLVGKPHAVIMTHEEQGQITKGVVASCSYQAKKRGVKSAMPLTAALRACPELVLNRVDLPYYLTISERVMQVLYRYSPILEQTSIDEAYLDCTSKIRDLALHQDHTSNSLAVQNSDSKSGRSIDSRGSDLAKEFAISIKNGIKRECGLLVSVGVAPTKSIAKIASDFKKPDGLTIVYPQEISNFLEDLEVDRISGIGTKTRRSLKQMGIETIGQLAKTDVQQLVQTFGNSLGIQMWKVARGQDEDPVQSRSDRISLSTESTLDGFTTDRVKLLSKLNVLAEELFSKMQSKGYMFRTIGVKIVHTDFVVETREKSYSRYQDTKNSIVDAIPGLLQKFYITDENSGRNIGVNDFSYSKTEIMTNSTPVRKLGVRLSNLMKKGKNELGQYQSSIHDYI